MVVLCCFFLGHVSFSGGGGIKHDMFLVGLIDLSVANSKMGNAPCLEKLETTSNQSKTSQYYWKKK